MGKQEEDQGKRLLRYAAGQPLFTFSFSQLDWQKTCFPVKTAYRLQNAGGKPF